MRHQATLFAAAALALSLLSVGCKKPPPPPPKVPTATPTPVPDKDVLGFVRGGSIFVMKYDGSAVRQLARPKAGHSLWFPMPSPAGDHLIAWLSDPDGTQDIVRLDLSGRMTLLTEIGARAQPLMKNLRLGNAPVYSPNGKRIAYSFNGDLWIMDANGYNAETFIADGASWAPAFSPDGKLLAYVNGTDGHYDVWLADIESRDTWQLTDFHDFTVGQPAWSVDGSRLLVTRSQGESSDVILVAVPKDGGMVSDGDPMTRDHLSGAAVWSPDGKHMLYSSARENRTIWGAFSADSMGGQPKALTKDSAFSPFWMRPSTSTAAVFAAVAAPSQPTPVPPASPKPVPVATNAVAAPAATPVPTVAAAVPAKAAQPASSASPQTAAPAPTAVAAKTQAPSSPVATKAPIQAAAKAPPLRLRLRASFEDDASLAPAGLTELKKLSPRVAQYDGESVTIIGPLDRSPLRGKFPNEESRSLARADGVAKQLVKQGKLKPASVKAQAYAPPAAGASGPPNSIQIYVELK